jgi:hypothetical protein
VLPSGQEVGVESLKDWIKGGSAGHTNPRPPLNPGFGPYQPIMPGFAQLTDEQLNDLIAYISTLDRSGQPTLPSLGPDGQPLPAQPAGTPASDGAAATPTP